MQRLKQRIFLKWQPNTQGALAEIPHGTLLELDGSYKVMTMAEFEQQRRPDDVAIFSILPPMQQIQPTAQPQKQEPQVIKIDVQVDVPKAKRSKQTVQRDDISGDIKSTLTDYEYE
jgi:hypothetical protein